MDEKGRGKIKKKFRREGGVVPVDVIAKVPPEYDPLVMVIKGYDGYASYLVVLQNTLGKHQDSYKNALDTLDNLLETPGSNLNDIQSALRYFLEVRQTILNDVRRLLGFSDFEIITGKLRLEYHGEGRKALWHLPQIAVPDRHTDAYQPEIIARKIVAGFPKEVKDPFRINV